MELKNTFKYHFALGFIIVVMDIFSNYVTSQDQDFFSRTFPCGIIYIITFYITFFIVYTINVSFISPKALKKKNLLYFILGLLSLFFVFPTIRYFLEEILVNIIWGCHNYTEGSRRFWFYIFDNSYHSLKVILFSTFIYLLFAFLRNKNKIHQLELEHQKAELATLKNQLEPHFLFNTLNVFYAELAITQPETAKGIHKLSELLRYLTYDAQKDFMPLKDEIKFIHDYIYFYRKRFENNLFLNLDIEGQVNYQQIPSLLIIHFIENIFKHGIVNDKNHPASIKINISEDYFQLQTQNKISNVVHYSTKGIGKENLKKRLQLLFDNNFEYSFNEEGQWYRTFLKIPLKK